MTSQLKHCDDGPTPEELLLSGHLVENDSIQLQTYEESLEITNRHDPRKRQRSVTPESVRNTSEIERQIANLRQHYPEYEIVSDIGSGLNWKRRGFVALLERIHTGGIEEVVVTRKV
jgi:predicted site-specific integrase-resolvase